MLMMLPKKHVRTTVETITTWSTTDSSGITLTNDNLTAGTAHTSTSWNIVRATKGLNTGRYVFEVNGSTVNSNYSYGLCTVDTPLNVRLGTVGTAVSRQGNGGFLIVSNMIRSASSFFSGTVATMMFAIDFDAGSCWIQHPNRTWVAGSPTSGSSAFTFTPNTRLYPCAGINGSYSGLVNLNVGTNGFTYDIPEGFNAWL